MSQASSIARLTKLSTLLQIVIIGLCAYALWACFHLMKVHAPLKTQAQAAELKESSWSGVCESEQKNEEGKDLYDCSAVVENPEYGYVTLYWFYGEEQQQQADGDNKEKKAEIVYAWRPIQTPIAQLAIGYYYLLICWCVLIGAPTRENRLWHLIVIVPAVLSVIAAGYYIYVMSFVLKQYCGVCLRLHGVDLVILMILAFMWWRAPTNKAKSTEEESKPLALTPISYRLLLATVVLPMALLTTHFVQRFYEVRQARLYFGYQRATKSLNSVYNDGQMLIDALRGGPPMEIPAREDAARTGKKDAVIQMTIFSDLQCPNCKNFEVAYKKQLAGQFEDRINMTFRHFPLSTSCNQLSSNYDKHPQACDAAYACEAARIQGGDESFWKMHDLILEHQSKLKSSDFPGYSTFAKQIGLDVAVFEQTMKSESVRQIVASDVAVARKVGVAGTPTVFINGRRINPTQRSSLAFWRELSKLSQQLEKQRLNQNPQP